MQIVRDRAVGGAEHRAHEQRRREHAARAADPHRQARRQNLRGEQPEQREDHVVACDGVLQDRVADAVHLRHGEQQQPEQHAADRGPQPVRAAPEPIGDVLAGVEHAHEAEADPGREHAEPRVERRAPPAS